MRLREETIQNWKFVPRFFWGGTDDLAGNQNANCASKMMAESVVNGGLDMNGKLLRISFAMVCLLASATLAFSQTQTAQNRIPQQIVIGGQEANGAYVTAPTGGMQSFTCSTPQQYATPDGSSQGWACYDAATGVWLLNAVPPAAAQAPAPEPAPLPAVPQPSVIYQQPPTVIYQQPAPTVVYAVPGYGYGYYGYGYPVYSPSVIWGSAAIRGAGGIISAGIIGNRYSYRPFYGFRGRSGRR